VIELNEEAEAAALNDNAASEAFASRISIFHSSFRALDLEGVRMKLDEDRATQLQAVSQKHQKLEDVASKDLVRRKVPKVLLAELGRESSDEAWEKLRIERIQERRQAPGINLCFVCATSK
jgi:hypothetical protein